MEHTGVGKRQRDGTLETVVKYDAEAFSTAWDYLADSDKEDESRFFWGVFFWCFFAPGKGGEKRSFWADWIFFRPLAHAGGCTKKKTEFDSKYDEYSKNTITFGIGHG